MDELGRLWKFVLHVLGGAAAASVIALVAIGLNFGAKYIEANEMVPMPIVWGLYGFEYFLFAVDALLLGRFIIVEAIKAWNGE